MIRLSDVKKIYPTSFGQKLVLDGISFDLAKGERLGILGRNGAGKSTMIRLISGAEKPTSGTIERHMTVSWPLAFGGAFQMMLTGRDNVRFISRIYGQDFRRNLAFVEEFAELGPYLNEPVRAYSSGMRARLAFAISMIIEFDCFLIDEIASVGDARFHARCNFELFEKRADRAMVIISHDAGYVRDSCNRFAVLIDGRLTEFGDFDTAYDFYGEQIGLERKGKTNAGQFASRAKALDASYQLAISDEAFRVQAVQGDMARNRSDWPEAEKGYSAALSLHPYERAYWAQLGHVLGAQGKFVQAEMAYRSACALGLPVKELKNFADAAMVQQGVSPDDFPLVPLVGSTTASNPPTKPEVEILTRFFWPRDTITEDETLELMRASVTFDDLVNRIASDRRAAKVVTKDHINFNTFYHACLIFGPSISYHREESFNSIPDETNLIEYLYNNDAFSGWTKTKPLIEAFLGLQN
jgi:ABC-type polysaccharide/polyol phosphate transport system ATPase subunit